MIKANFMFKKSLAIICGLLMFTSVFAQEVNEKGLKVVSKIKTTMYVRNGRTQEVSQTNVANIEFGYDSSLRLQEISFKETRSSGRNFSKTYRKSGNKILRSDYENGKLDKDYSFDYTLNEDNLIQKCVITNHNSDNSGGGLRHVYDFDYVNNPYYNAGMVERVTEKWYTKLSRNKPWVKGDGNMEEYYDFATIDGNTLNKKEWMWDSFAETSNGYKYDDFIYIEDYINDTNINWCGLVIQYVKKELDIDFLTEWANVRSLNHIRYLDYTKSVPYRFEYTRNSDDNLIMIEIYKVYRNKEGKMYKYMDVEIDYLY